MFERNAGGVKFQTHSVGIIVAGFIALGLKRTQTAYKCNTQQCFHFHGSRSFAKDAGILQKTMPTKT
jgi:hypothetical protein